MMQKSLNRQIFTTSILLIFVILLFYFTNFDLDVQENFYDFESKSWLIDKKEPLLKFIFYDGFKGGAWAIFSHFNHLNIC